MNVFALFGNGLYQDISKIWLSVLYIIKYQMKTTKTPHVLCVGVILSALLVPTALGKGSNTIAMTQGDSKVGMGTVAGNWTPECSPRALALTHLPIHPKMQIRGESGIF